MTAVTIDLPDSVLAELGDSPDRVAREVRLAVAVEWFRRGMVSQGRAAEIAGLSRAELIDELLARKIPLATVKLEDLQAELGTGHQPWMRFAGIVENGDPDSSTSVNTAVFGPGTP